MNDRPTLGELVDIELELEKIVAQLNTLHGKVKDLRKLEYLRLNMIKEGISDE